MISRMFLPALVGTLLFAAVADAAVLAPVKGYDKPDEPILIRFLNENEPGKKALEKIGLEATKLDGLFTPAPLKEITADGKPLFQLYTFDGKQIEPKSSEALAKPDGTVDVSQNFPELREAGTYVLVWKDATPIVIETLRNPIPWAVVMDEKMVPADQREAYLKYLDSQPPVVTHLVPLQYALISTDHGDIKTKFFYDVAPHTVDNFISLADQKFYDASAFHRVMLGFMIQGGDSLANSDKLAGTGGPGYSIPAELSNKEHDRGILSMARTERFDSAGSQFFIVQAKSKEPDGKYGLLDGKYTIFGDVIDGMKVVDDIAATPSDPKTGAVIGPRPKIESIRALPATPEMYGLGKKQNP